MRKKILFNSLAFLLLTAVFTPVAFGQDNPDVDLVPSAIAPVNVSANTIVRFIINALIVVGVIASLIWLIYGGIRWVISGGDKAKVDAARGTIVAAIVGLIVVVLAYVIINVVLQVLTGSGISGFKLPTLIDTEALPSPARQQ